MPLTTRKRTFKKAGASIEEELPETRYGKVMGKYSGAELEELFRMVKGREERMHAITFAIEHNVSIADLVKKVKLERERLR